MSESSDRRRAQYTMPYASSQKALPPPVRNARQCHLCGRRSASVNNQQLSTIALAPETVRQASRVDVDVGHRLQIHRAHIIAEGDPGGDVGSKRQFGEVGTYL